MNQTGKTRFVAGAAWMVAWRWLNRLIGLISTVILARLLTPEDFGIVAMATIVIGLLEAVSLTGGVAAAIIRMPEITDSHLNTGWTIRLIQRMLMALLLVPGAFLAANYFDEERVVAVVLALAGSVVISGFENVSVILFRRALKFEKDFVFGVINKLVGFGATIGFAVILYDYWALVIGIFAMSLSRVIASYAMEKYRPRFSLERFRELWSFSQWILVSSVIDFTKLKVDQVVVGGALGNVAMGKYVVGSDLGLMPTAEISSPLAGSLLPNMSRLNTDPTEFNRMFLRVLNISAVLSIPIGLGISFLAPELVAVVLGSKWQDVVPVVQWIAVFGLVRSLVKPIRPAMTAIGKPKMLTLIDFIELLVVVPVVTWTAYNATIGEVAFSRFASLFALLPIIYLLLPIRSLHIRPRDIVKAIYRPLVAGLAMLLPLYLVRALNVLPEIAFVLLSIAVGAAAYVLFLLLLCSIAGLKDTNEYFVYQKLSSKMFRRPPGSL